MELGLYDPQDGAFLLKVFDCQSQKFTGAQAACVQEHRCDPAHPGMQWRVISAWQPIGGGQHARNLLGLHDHWAHARTSPGEVVGARYEELRL
jgi:hypothetical protein